MHGLLSAVLAVDEVDPAAVRPSPTTSVVFGFLLLATILLLWSFVRHMRRAQANLGSSRTVPGSEDGPEGESS